MEQNNSSPAIDLSFYSLVKIFKGKLKMLIAIAVVSTMLGGTIGALTVTMAKKTYGNTLTYYFPTKELSGYADILPLLESNMFTENILIGTKTVSFTDAENNTTDIKIPDLPYTPEEESELAEYEYKKLTFSKKAKELKDELKEIPFELNILKAELDGVTVTYEDLTELLKTYTNTPAEQFVVNNQETIAAIESELKTVREEKHLSEEAYNTCLNRQHEAEQELFEAEKEVEIATKESDKILSTLRNEWRSVDKNKRDIELIQNNVTYSFTKDTGVILPPTSTEEVDNKFLYIFVEIPENQKLASKIIKNIESELPDFVISNTTPAEKNDDIKCLKISAGEAKNLNDGKIISSIIKFAVIFLVAFEAIAFIAVIASHVKRTVLTDEIKSIPEKNDGEAEASESSEESDSDEKE